MQLPNIRKNFVPDPGMMVFDIDLDRADAQVVAWDSGCENLKKAFRRGLDTHLLNANLVYGLGLKEDDLVDGSEPHKKIKKEYASYRNLAKAIGHATNYLASPKTIATNAGIQVRQAEKFQELYFDVNPEIPDWHDQIEKCIQTTRTIRNVFSYHITYFDRMDKVMTDAVAWIPQSTIGIITNHMWNNLDCGSPDCDIPEWGIEIWFQVHDSLVGQFPAKYYPDILPLIKERTEIVMPYDDPRAIPTGIKVSRKSWGDAKDVDWGVTA